jgi:hypothetical protein
MPLQGQTLLVRIQESRLSPADFLRAVEGGNPAPVVFVQADALVPDEFSGYSMRPQHF